MTEIMVGLIPVATFAIGFLVGRSHTRGEMRIRLARGGRGDLAEAGL